MILAIIGLVVMGFILGFGCRKSDSFYETVQLEYEREKFGKCASLENRVFILERENERLNYLVQEFGRTKRNFYETFAARCSSCNKNFYSKTLDDQKVADMLKSITLTSEEIAKKLGMIIP